MRNEMTREQRREVREGETRLRNEQVGILLQDGERRITGETARGKCSETAS